MQDFIRYIPHTEEDCQRMLETIGIHKLEDLFENTPNEFRCSKPLNLPDALPEPDLLRHLQGLQSLFFTTLPIKAMATTTSSSVKPCGIGDRRLPIEDCADMNLMGAAPLMA